MNITADPGLLYNMSELFTIVVVYSLKMNYNKSILNITKQNTPPIWSRNPSILSINTKDDTFIILVL